MIRTRFLPPISSHNFLRPVSPPVMGDAATVDLKSLMSSSHDTIAHTYHTWASKRPTDARTAYLQHLAALVPAGSPLLELGCGAGVPGTRQLVELGFAVMGVNVSSSILDIARRELVAADFHLGDMLSFSPSASRKYPCVLAFYSLPPAEQTAALERWTG